MDKWTIRSFLLNEIKIVTSHVGCVRFIGKRQILKIIQINIQYYIMYDSIYVIR